MILSLRPTLWASAGNSGPFEERVERRGPHACGVGTLCLALRLAIPWRCGALLVGGAWVHDRRATGDGGRTDAGTRVMAPMRATHGHRTDPAHAARRRADRAPARKRAATAAAPRADPTRPLRNAHTSSATACLRLAPPAAEAALIARPCSDPSRGSRTATPSARSTRLRKREPCGPRPVTS
jgi:hypothetical protein